MSVRQQVEFNEAMRAARRCHLLREARKTAWHRKWVQDMDRKRDRLIVRALIGEGAA